MFIYLFFLPLVSCPKISGFIEVANNAWRESSSHSDGEEFRKRKMAAVRAYFEWMPLRQVQMDDHLRIWRKFSFGSLMDLIMLDTRYVLLLV